jgi:hypothetical protein
MQFRRDAQVNCCLLGKPVAELWKKLVMAVAIATAPMSTQAAVYSVWGAHGAVEFSVPIPVTVAAGSFSDYWTFSVGEPLVKLTSVANANNNGSFRISPGATYALWSYGLNGVFDAGGVDDELKGSWGFDGTTGSTQNPAIVGAGSYYYSVSGDAAGDAGGRYQITSTLAPVPAPESLGLLAAGLGLLSLVAWRRLQTGNGGRYAMA